MFAQLSNQLIKTEAKVATSIDSFVSFKKTMSSDAIRFCAILPSSSYPGDKV